MIKAKLNTQPLLLQLPIGESATFAGVVDLVTMEALLYSDTQGREIKRVPISECKYLYFLRIYVTLIFPDDGIDHDEVKKARIHLVESTAGNYKLDFSFSLMSAKRPR